MRHVHLAVDEATADLWPDDRVLVEHLGALGIEADPLVWGTPTDADAVVLIRSTWDYVDRPDDFADWLDELDARQVTVLNPTALLRWNAHKRYLLELADRDVPVVPTELVAKDTPVRLRDLIDRRGWSDVVVKPAVGGSARLTVHAARIGDAAAAEHFDRLVAAEDLLVQPFVPSVVAVGETSVVAVAGEPLAAIVKRAADGDWRVQSDFGGTAERVELTADLRAIAQQALDAAPSSPAYARIDVVRTPAGWQLLELELIEPELFFPLVPEVAQRLAEAVAAIAAR